MPIAVRTLAALLSLAALQAAAPAQAPPTACTLEKTHYSCDRSQFTKLLQTAKSVAIETHPFNQLSTTALESLVRELGKSVQTGPADLVFVLDPAQPDGIYFGPNDKELATLLVFQQGPGGKRGPLLWVETFAGQPDMPWLMVVRGIIQQFKHEFK